MKRSKSLRGIGILLIAALSLSCNLLQGPELPYKVSIGKDPIPMKMPVPEEGTFVTYIIACVKNNHTPGCTQEDIPISGLPIKAFNTQTFLWGAPIKSVARKLVTGDNGTVTFLEKLGGSARDFQYPDNILLETTEGDQLKCLSDFSSVKELSYENLELIFDDCFPTQRTMNGRERL